MRQYFENGKIRPRLLLVANRKVHMRFRLAPRSMTLDDLELYKFEFSENFAGSRRFWTQQQLLNEWRQTSIVSARCKDVELEQFLATFRVARVCRQLLGFLVVCQMLVVCVC